MHIPLQQAGRKVYWACVKGKCYGIYLLMMLGRTIGVAIIHEEDSWSGIGGLFNSIAIILIIY